MSFFKFVFFEIWRVVVFVFILGFGFLVVVVRRILIRFLVLISNLSLVFEYL